MKHTQYLVLAILSLLLFSCNEKPKTLKPVSSKIEGPLAECFEVVTRDYKIIGNQVNIEFVRINGSFLPSQISAEFLDDSGNVIATSNLDLDSDYDELKFLLANKVGESSSLTFTVGNGNPTQVRLSSSLLGSENNGIQEEALEAEELLEETLEQAVDIISEQEAEMEEALEEITEDNEDEDEDEEETPTPTVSSYGSKDWDKVLDDFESYVDHYINLLNKATSGDLSAITEYATVLEKAEKLDKDLNAAQNEMTKAQMKRYVRITKKMTDAAYDMYDKVY